MRLPLRSISINSPVEKIAVAIDVAIDFVVIDVDVARTDVNDCALVAVALVAVASIQKKKCAGKAILKNSPRLPSISQFGTAHIALTDAGLSDDLSSS